jgi:protein kinase
MVHNKKENEVNIVFEYCDKNLFQAMQDRARKNQSWNEQEIKTVMYQCVAAINYMHKNGYMHRDVKPENYLINNTSGPLAADQIQIKLADFGLAKDFRSNGSGKFTEYVATRWYRAPELVLRTSNYNQSVDIFALGAIMAELYLGRPIFPGVNETDQLTRIVTVLGTPTSSEWPEGIQLAQQKGIQIPQVTGTSLRQHFASTTRGDISDEAFDLMAKMFKYASDQRITAAQCL